MSCVSVIGYIKNWLAFCGNNLRDCIFILTKESLLSHYLHLFISRFWKQFLKNMIFSQRTSKHKSGWFHLQWYDSPRIKISLSVMWFSQNRNNFWKRFFQINRWMFLNILYFYSFLIKETNRAIPSQRQDFSISCLK